MPQVDFRTSRRGFKNEYRSKGNEVGLGIDMQSNSWGLSGIYISVYIYTHRRSVFDLLHSHGTENPLLCFVKLRRTKFRFGLESLVVFLFLGVPFRIHLLFAD